MHDWSKGTIFEKGTVLIPGYVTTKIFILTAPPPPPQLVFEDTSTLEAGRQAKFYLPEKHI